MNDVWILAEHHKGVIKEVSYELLAWGRSLADSLGCSLCALLFSPGTEEGQLTSLIKHGADVIYYCEDSSYTYVTCETYTHVIEDLVKKEKPQILLGAATTTGRSVLPYLAVKISSGLTADCTHLAIEEGTNLLLQTRPAIGGNIMATIKTPNHTPQMATVRPKSKKPLPKDLNRTGSIISIPFSSSYADKRVTVLEEQPLEGSEGSIEESKRVISGGKGLKKKDNFERIVRLASLMHGAVGASREAVDRGWIGYSHQVGLSGKTISPELYMAIGISGAVQHLAGIKTSKYIVSINDDITAPIIQISDFAIVGDLFTICDEIERQITNKGGRCD